MFKTPVLLCSLFLIGSLAEADTIQLSATGSVTSSNLAAIPIGQAITISIAYESSGAPFFQANQHAYYNDHLSSVSISTNNYNTTSANSGAFGQIDIYDNVGGDGVGFQAGKSVYYQQSNPLAQAVLLGNLFSSNVSMTFENMYFNLASNNSSLWSGYALPVINSFGAYDQTRNFLISFSGGGISGGFTSLTSTNLTASPEPGTWLLVASSLVAAGWFARRRRA